MNVDIYTVILLVIAVVIFLRLRSVLGRRTGTERPPVERDEAKPEVETAAIDEKIRTLAPAGSMLNEGLKAIAAADRSFDPDAFLAGARAAYEMIVTAFAEGDRKTLRNLFSREVNDGFVAAIAQREQ